jgi:hypothetical protein
MSNTLIEPTSFAVPNSTPQQARNAFYDVERACSGAVGQCQTNETRLAWWRLVTEYGQTQITNIEGRLAGQNIGGDGADTANTATGRAREKAR